MDGEFGHFRGAPAQQRRMHGAFGAVPAFAFGRQHQPAAVAQRLHHRAPGMAVRQGGIEVPALHGVVRQRQRSAAAVAGGQPQPPASIVDREKLGVAGEVVGGHQLVAFIAVRFPLPGEGRRARRQERIQLAVHRLVQLSVQQQEQPAQQHPETEQQLPQQAPLQ